MGPPHQNRGRAKAIEDSVTNHNPSALERGAYCPVPFTKGPGNRRRINMLNLLNTYKNQRSWLEQVKRAYSWQFAVKRESALVGFLIKSSRLLLGKMSRSWVLAILHFSRDCIRLRRLSGSKGLALYLKACSVLLMKYCARQELKDLGPLKARVSRTKSGIPRIVVPYYRECIRKNDRMVIRLWMTLFGLYRVIEFKGVFSLKTITSPFCGNDQKDHTFLIDWFVKQLQIS